MNSKELKDIPVEHVDPRGYKKFRAWLHLQHPSVNIVYKIAIAIAGLIVVIGGLILVPLPGPGWLIVFLGIGILGLEFPAANRLNAWIKMKLAKFWAWWKARKRNV